MRDSTSSCLENFSFSSLQRDKMEKYAEMLLKWNQRINLTGARNSCFLKNSLFCDSLELANFMSKLFPSADDNLLVWDLGAGAGLPGIPLRIVWQSGSYVMVEARQKRALFLANALAILKLPRTLVFAGRAEKYFALAQKPASCILSRAFMPWRDLLHFCSPGLAADGILMILASEAPPEMPPEWDLFSAHSYFARNKTHWIWALKHVWQ